MTDKTINDLDPAASLSLNDLMIVAAPGGPAQRSPIGDLVQFFKGPLFVELGDYVLPIGDTTVTTAGWSREGWGGATYVVTATTGETNYRTQLASGQWVELASQIPHVGVFGVDPLSANNDIALAQAFEWAGPNGRTLTVLPGRYVYLSRRMLPRNIVLEGAGWDSVLAGPGFDTHGTALDGAGFVTYEQRNPTIRFLTFDGEAYTASGRGIDVLGANFVTIEYCNFLGFKHQVVLDVVQRSVIRRNRFNASVGSISGVWIPRGPEAHPLVDFAVHPTNVVSITDNHFSWFNGSTGWGIIDHGGLQHEIARNQSSFGRAHLRLGGVSGMRIGLNDWEFSTTWSIETVNTNLDGAALATTANIIVLEPGGYFDKPMNIQHAKALVVTGTDFFISGQPAIQGVANLRMVRSIGNKNNRTGGTILDAMPTDSGASIFQFDEENFLPVVRMNPASFTPDFTIEEMIAGVRSRILAAATAGRIEGRRDNTTTWVASAIDGYIQPGSQNGRGVRIYSNIGAPDASTAPGSPPGQSIYIEQLPAGGNYTDEYMIWVKGDDATWRQMFRPRGYTVAQLASVPATDRREVWVTDRHRPAWGDGSDWRFGDNAVVS